MNQNKKLFPIVVLISGNGSNLQAIIDQCQHALPVQIQAVISNESDAYGLERAKQAGIPTHVVSHRAFPTREEFEHKLRETIDQYQPQLIVFAGFMRFLTSTFVSHYSGRMINVHPSLLPKYKGLHTYRRVLASGDSIHGISIHFVTDDLDGGPIICQAAYPILPNDDEECLKKRGQSLEHQIYPQVINWFANKRLKLHLDQVELDGKLLPKQGLQLSPTHLI